MILWTCTFKISEDVVLFYVRHLFLYVSWRISEKGCLNEGCFGVCWPLLRVLVNGPYGGQSNFRQLLRNWKVMWCQLTFYHLAEKSQPCWVSSFDSCGLFFCAEERMGQTDGYRLRDVRLKRKKRMPAATTGGLWLLIKCTQLQTSFADQPWF